MPTSAAEDPPTTREVASPLGIAPPQERQFGFVVLWSAEAEVRSGAFLALPASGDPNQTFILGRGRARSDDRYVRLRPILQRPDEQRAVPPFESPSLSRIQLEVRSTSTGAGLNNVGRCALNVNGSVTQRAQVEPGDLVEIGRQLLLFCTMRAPNLAGDGVSPTHAFGEPDDHGLVGESPAIWSLRQRIRFVAGRSGHVLIVGDSGTGKELIAGAIHALSKPGKAWVARNASTIPETLLDSELYGNAKGYPNVGMPERKGLIGAADHSSLFLDEFAELPLSAQSHLLRVLDAGEYQRLGEATSRRSDFRLIAATNRPSSQLRTDALMRFAFSLAVPDLAARREDIPLLARHWLRELGRDDPAIRKRVLNDDGEPRLSSSLIAALVRRTYTGNIRELRNLLWQAISDSREGELRLPLEQPQATVAEPTAEHLRQTLAANDGSIEKTWRALGLTSRHALTRLMRKSGVRVQRQLLRK